MSFKYRDYQEEAVRIGLEVLRDNKGRKAVIVAPTGAGKSIIIGGIAKELTDGKVLVLSHSKEILEQNLEKINYYGIYPSVYSASLGRKETEGNLIYATHKSINYEAFRDLNIKYVLIDEADFSTKSGTVLHKLMTKLKIKNLLGFTATPTVTKVNQDGSYFEMMTKDKKSLFNEICYVLDIDYLVKNNYWSNLKYYTPFAVNKNLLKLNSTKAEYTEESQKEFYDDNGTADKIIEILKRKPLERNALVFVPSVYDAEYLATQISGSVAISSRTDKKLRKKYIDGFKSGEIKIVFNALLLGIGFDFSELSLILDCAPTNSFRNNYQKIGRGVRTHKGKEVCDIIDLCGNYEKFGDIRNIKIENVENYGWAIFNNNKLITDVLLDSKETTTKEDLKIGKKPITTENFKFSKECDGLAKMSVGQNKGIALQRLYHTKRFYLKWLIEKEFKFKPEDAEFERQLKLMFSQ